MNQIERHYRLTVLSEHVERLDVELAALTLQMRNGPELDRLASARWHLTRAAEQILGGPTPKTNLETALRLSIQLVKDRLKCEGIGGAIEGV